MNPIENEPGTSRSTVRFPEHGRAKDEILAHMRAQREEDVRWRDGKVFSLVFHAGDEIHDLLKEAYTMFFSENGLNPTAFPSLRKFETEVISMSIDLLGGDENAVGHMTSGGTESILMAVKTARDWARANRPEITVPEMILPLSAHPAFEKAAHYFDVRPVHTPLEPDFGADIDAVEAAITPNTILVVGSAPSYPQGIVDPIRDLAALAAKHGLLCHVDACVGGFMLPFARRLGYPVPDFDFSVPGVTSISADLHKYGYAAKGASVILYRSREIRRYQLFAYTDWPGGIYASPAVTGTRPGGAIAAAWAVLNFLGEDGYLRIAEKVMQAAKQIQAGIDEIEDLYVLGSPAMSVFAIGAKTLNIFEIGDEMTQRGWHLDRQQFPACLHMTVNFAHADIVDGFLADLAQSAAKAGQPSLHRLGNAFVLKFAQLATRVLPEKTVTSIMARLSPLLAGGAPSPTSRSAAMYGMMGTLPNRGDLNELVLDLLEDFTRPR